MSRTHSSGRSMSPLALVSGIAGILFGIIVGYLIATQQTAPGAAAAGIAIPAGHPPMAGAQAPVVNEQELQAYRDILEADPENTRAATELANRLYDAGRFSEAIAHYQQVFAADPRNVHVSTDLGTALWYTGRADDAIAQFEKSLAVEATHPQTLFNMGIVRAEGKQDYAGAVQAWEQLLTSNPTYPEADRVRRLIDDAKGRGTGK
jgi:cytochrome c-type biogenesis protein CcmH/NrfG